MYIKKFFPIFHLIKNKLFFNRDLRDEIARIQVELEFKNKLINDTEIKLKETRAECNILQNSHQRLNLVNFFKK